MAYFVIGYDQQAGKNSPEVLEALKEWRAVRLLDVLWLVEHDTSPADLRDVLERAMKGEGGIAVIELKAGSEWAAFRAKPSGVAWLRNHILP